MKTKIDGTMKCSLCGFEHPCKVRDITKDSCTICSNTKDYKQFQRNGGLDTRCRDTISCFERRFPEAKVTDKKRLLWDLEKFLKSQTMEYRITDAISIVIERLKLDVEIEKKVKQ